LSSGETDYSSSRIAIEANKCLFNCEDVSPTYSRKIDLLLKYDDNESVDLCSNEWKKTKVTNGFKLKQQSKNLRVNTCIINSLQRKYGDFQSVLALDVVGKYKIGRVED
jgi:hypothetical protein